MSCMFSNERWESENGPEQRVEIGMVRFTHKTVAVFD